MDYSNPAPKADEVIFRPTDKKYPRQPQVVLGNRQPPEFDVVPLKVDRLADVAQIYADFSRKEVHVPRDLLDRSRGIAGTGAVQARYLIESYDMQLADFGIDIVPLGRDVVAFRAGKSIEERKAIERPANATPDQVAAATAAMSHDRFWQLVEAAGRAGRGDGFQLAAALQAALTKLTANEILGFQLRMNERAGESYRWDLWGIAYMVNGGASDDGFEYFRGWLIAQGKTYYEAALKDPVRAADRAGPAQDNENEEILQAGNAAYQAKMGRLPPMLPHCGRTEPAGARWEEKDLPKLYPELVKRFR